MLRNLFAYEPDTGVLTYKYSSGRKKRGAVAGVIGKRGRRVISIRGKKFYASRIIWAIVTGRWPVRLVDHRNRIKTDDRWDNLREADYQQNAANLTFDRSRNQHGFVGVRKQSQKEGRKTFRFYATIKVRGVDKYLGRFDTALEAAKVRDAAATRYFGEFARLNFPEGRSNAF